METRKSTTESGRGANHGDHRETQTLTAIVSHNVPFNESLGAQLERHVDDPESRHRLLEYG